MESIRWAFRFTNWQPTRQEWSLCSRLIQLEEKERIGRFVFRKDAKSSMIGRILIRKYLCQTLGIKNSELNLVRDDKGKPLLNEPKINNILFNVSHQGDIALLAGCNNVPIPEETPVFGVDVMNVEYKQGKDLKEYFRLMKRNFSFEEFEQFGKTNEENYLNFCRLWALKESYVKAIGTGITINLSDISFKLNSELIKNNINLTTTLKVRNNLLNNWKFEESWIDEKHIASVAYNFNCDSKLFQFKSLQELTNNLDPILPEDTDYVEQFLKKDEKPY